MLVYYLGIPGSGKTYSAVNTIFNNFSNDKQAKKDLKKDYINCYTNINEFKFDKVQSVFPLILEDFYNKLVELHTMYKAKSTDEELILKAKELKIYKSLIIIDECHNFLDSSDVVKVWWLTYHRHLYHDIILITQNLALVNSKYKPLAEAFYRAKPNSLTLNHKYFNYTYFTDSRMSKSGKVNVLKVKRNKKVFDLYKSGDSVKSKNVLAYFLTISFIFLIILIIFTYLYSSKTKEDINNAKSKDYKHNSINNTSVKKFTSSNDFTQTDDDFSNKILVTFNCSYSVCSSKQIAIPPQLLKKFIDMKQVHIYYQTKINKNLSVFYISMTNDFYNFLNFQKGVQNENSSSSSSLSLFGGK